MTDSPTRPAPLAVGDTMNDLEATAALDAYMPMWRSQNNQPMWKSVANMRAALDAAAQWRCAQPTSGLAEDVAKIVEASKGMLKLFGHPLKDEYVDGGATFKLARETVAAAKSALPIAESLAGKIEALEMERDEEVCELKQVIAHRDRMMNSKFVDVAARDAEIARLTNLSRPLPVTVDGCEPSDDAIARAIREWFWVEDDEGSEELEKASNESGRLIESSVSTMKSVLRLAYRIDVAPRLAAEYGRGVDDAREKATDHGKSHE